MTAPKRWTLEARFNPQGDGKILQTLYELQYATVEHQVKWADLKGEPRSPTMIRFRLREVLEPLHYTDCLDYPDRSARKVHRLAPKGLEYCREVLKLDNVEKVYNAEKSERMLPHDCFLTDVHIRIEEECAKFGWWIALWEQRRGVIEHQCDECSVNPDVFFVLSNEKMSRAFFWEREKSRQHSYVDGKSGLIRKLEDYVRYGNGAFQERWDFKDFRLLVTMPMNKRAIKEPEKRVMNLANKCLLQDDTGLFSRKFYLSTDELFLADPLGAIFTTPKDCTGTFANSAKFSLIG